MPDRQIAEDALTLFIIPLGMLFFAWLIRHKRGMRLGAGADLFLFLASLDLTYLVRVDIAQKRINPHFIPYYGPLFAFLLVVSLILLVFATIVDDRISKVQASKNNKYDGSWQVTAKGTLVSTKYYPLGSACAVWLFAVASIDFHLVLLVGS